MTVDTSLWGYFYHASIIVKMVMLILISASIASWTFIIQRWFFLKDAHNEMVAFEDDFWSGEDLAKLYKNIHDSEKQGMSAIFYAGFKEFLRLCPEAMISADAIMAGAKRAMNVAHMRETERLETHLSFLATVGSISPYVGLFGTVWGIMTSFRALAVVQQATISMVAPGISEALIATALGLFAAIPAVIAYNRYANSIERLQNRYDAFEEEFASILYRKAQSSIKKGG